MKNTSDSVPSKDGPAINNQIRAQEIRLIDFEGEMVGVVSLRTALSMAEVAGFDLVEISPQAEPPVCKIMDYGKYRYEMQKKKHEAKKNQKVVEVKEIKLRPTIENNDYLVKFKMAQKFLADGNKVKVTMRFRGREMAHQEFGMRIFNKLQEDLQEIAKIEQAPKFEGVHAMMLLGPK